MVHLCPYFFSRQSVGMWMIILLWFNIVPWRTHHVRFTFTTVLLTAILHFPFFWFPLVIRQKCDFGFPLSHFPMKYTQGSLKQNRKKKIKLVRFHPFYSLIDMQQVKRRRKCATPDQYSLWPSSRSPFAWMEYNIWKKNVKKLCSFISFQLLSPSFLFLTDHRPS